MKFKKWFNEVVDPITPKGLKKSTIVKNQSTNTATKVIQFKWKTQRGNIVKIHFEPTGKDFYNIVFYVNDTLEDDSSKNNISNRDPEILPGVFHVIKTKADELKVNHLSFKAEDSPKDTRIIRNLPINDLNALEKLNEFKQALLKYQVKLVQPSQTKINLMAKLKRPYPQPEPDIDKNLWLKWVKDIENNLNNPNPDGLDNFINQLITKLSITNNLHNLNFDFDKLINELKKTSNILKSNSKAGWSRTINRRQKIYEKLVYRYFPDWEIDISGNYFYLNRK